MLDGSVWHTHEYTELQSNTPKDFKDLPFNHRSKAQFKEFDFDSLSEFIKFKI